MIKLVSYTNTFKYKGKWYVAGVPNSFDCDEIPEELIGIVEYYEDKKNVEENGLLIKEKPKSEPKKRGRKKKEPKMSDSQDNAINDLGLDLSKLI